MCKKINSYYIIDNQLVTKLILILKIKIYDLMCSYFGFISICLGKN